jgi:thiol:disulfide interchange protein DsbA
MNKLPALLAMALAALGAACSQKSPDAAAPATEAAPPAAAATNAAPPTQAEIKKAAEATQESAGASSDSPGDASLERMAAMPENAQLPSGKWKPGTHYLPIVPAQPTSAEPGQVEVLEVLWLGCPHCADMEPTVESWKKKKPAYVKFVQEHVMWGPVHRAHARLFYTLETLGRADLVTKAFEEIHRRGNMLVAATDGPTAQMHLAFARANGIAEADFKREYTGFAVNTRLQRAEELMRRYKIEFVPRFIINGKYEAGVEMAGGREQLIALINDLAAAEKSR